MDSGNGKGNDFNNDDELDRVGAEEMKALAFC